MPDEIEEKYQWVEPQMEVPAWLVFQMLQLRRLYIQLDELVSRWEEQHGRRTES